MVQTKNTGHHAASRVQSIHSSRFPQGFSGPPPNSHTNRPDASGGFGLAPQADFLGEF